jgi:hypothetical protein
VLDRRSAREVGISESAVEPMAQRNQKVLKTIRTHQSFIESAFEHVSQV